jgi:2-oxoglutarate ferredoxin oxidoreductase subunit alpha
VRSGGWVLYDSTWPLDKELHRSDVTFLGVPYAKLCAEAFKDSRERTLMKNIAYVGALAALLDIDMDVVLACSRRSSARSRRWESNHKAIQLGYEYARELRAPPPDPPREDGRDEGLDPHRRQHRDGPRLRVRGRDRRRLVPHHAGTSVLDAFKASASGSARDKDREEELRLLQAEDELAAIGMVIGASWAARAPSPPRRAPASRS